MIDLHTQHHFSDNVYAKEMHLPKDHWAESHQHNYSHLSILGTGRVTVTCDGESKEYTAPACIEIKAGVVHRIVALEDSVWYCIHATEERDINKIDEVLIKKED